MGTATVGVVFSGAPLPSLIHLDRTQAPGERQVQALPGHDGVEIGMLAQRAPVGLAEGWAAFAACLSFAALVGSVAPEAPVFWRGTVRPLMRLLEHGPLLLAAAWTSAV